MPVLLAGLGLLVRGIASLVARASLIAVVRIIAVLMGKGLVQMVLMPGVTLLWRITVKIAVFAMVYKFFTGWLIFKAYDVLDSAIGLLPGPDHPGFTRFWQLVTATEPIIPWDHIGFTLKWVILLLLWVTVWRYTEAIMSMSWNFIHRLFS